jgi:hypothetical protein
MGMFIILYLIFHTPAIIMLIIGLNKRKSDPDKSTVLLIIAGVYFVIGGGMCASMARF